MSGEGILRGPPHIGARFEAGQVAGRSAERGDVLAYLARRRANAETMAREDPGSAELAADRARQIGIIIGEIETGLHVGEADAARVIAPEGKEAS